MGSRAPSIYCSGCPARPRHVGRCRLDAFSRISIIGTRAITVSPCGTVYSEWTISAHDLCPKGIGHIKRRCADICKGAQSPARLRMEDAYSEGYALRGGTALKGFMLTYVCKYGDLPHEAFPGLRPLAKHHTQIGTVHPAMCQALRSFGARLWQLRHVGSS